MTSICVADISRDYSDQIGLSLWMPIGRYGLHGSYLYDYHLNYPVLISVWLLTNSNQCECLAISVYVWQSEYVLAYIQSYFFFISFITQIICIVFFVAK